MAYVNKTGREDALSAKITEAVGLRRHIKMNFVPCMLTSLALDQTLKACDAAARNRCSEVKKETRELRRMAEAYTRRLAQSLGGEADAFAAVVGRFDEHTSTHQWLAELQSKADSRNTKACPEGGEELAAHATMAYALLRHAETCDEEASDTLSIVLGKPVTRRREPELGRIMSLLSALGAKGYMAMRSKQSEQWVKVIANKASALADEMIDEEQHIAPNKPWD